MFSTNHTEHADNLLVQEAIAGNKKALEKLIKVHQDYIYNIALRLYLDPDDALDATQDVLIKVITHLNTFAGKSQFRTWLYRIVINHFIDSPKRKMEKMFIQISNSITDFGNDEDEFNQDEIEEVRISCTTAMLMCLNREQRLLYIIGEVFDADHTVGAELFETTPANYRVKLHRAKADLLNFVMGKCGIINPQNPCRCPKKTRILINQGLVDRDNLRFNTSFVNTVSEIIEHKREAVADQVQHKLKYLFRDNPFQIRNELDHLITEFIK